MIRVFVSLARLALLFAAGVYVAAANLISPSAASARSARFGRRIVAEFHALSGLYIKFGQLLAARPDLLRAEIASELDKLFDEAPPEPLARARLTMAEEWTEAIAREIGTIDETPVAGASFASVYKGRLEDGTTVAIKVQRRNIRETTRRDLRVIKLCARLIDLTGMLGRFRVSRFVDEFAAWTHEELDYVLEAQHMEYLRRHLPPNSRLVIPRVHWKYSTSRVLVMDYLEGTWLTHLSRTQQACSDRALARKVFVELMFQVFEIGFFHADPHPGNLCAMADGRIGLIDFGIMGRTSERERRAQLDLLWAMVDSDLEAAFEAVLKLSVVPQDADVERFQRLFERNMTKWLLMQQHPMLPSALRSGMRLMFANLSAAGECGIQIKSTAARYYRALLVLENLTLRVDSTFRQQDELRRYFRAHFIRDVVALKRFRRHQIERLARSWYRIEQLTQQLTAPARGPEPPTRLNRVALVCGKLAKAGSSILIAVGLLSLILIVAEALAPDTYAAFSSQPGWWAILASRLATIWAAGTTVVSAFLLRWSARLLWIRAYEPGPYVQ